jgi:hypothetical protein
VHFGAESGIADIFVGSAVAVALIVVVARVDKVVIAQPVRNEVANPAFWPAAVMGSLDNHRRTEDKPIDGSISNDTL